jgi:primosomal protein N'
MEYAVFDALLRDVLTWIRHNMKRFAATERKRRRRRQFPPFL